MLFIRLALSMFWLISAMVCDLEFVLSSVLVVESELVCEIGGGLPIRIGVEAVLVSLLELDCPLVVPLSWPGAVSWQSSDPVWSSWLPLTLTASATE